MAATVTLSSTTLAQAVNVGDLQIKVASTSGIVPGMKLYADRELMQVVSLGIAPWINVLRGRDGTPGTAHAAGVTLWIGTANQFYDVDPKGAPDMAVAVSPYINIRDGRVFFAQGDTSNPNMRWWQQQTSTYDYGALGVRTVVLNPTSST